MGIKTLRTAADLRDLALDLGVQEDWHEPDQQDVTVEVAPGGRFDNAQNDPLRHYGWDPSKMNGLTVGVVPHEGELEDAEMAVFVLQEEQPVAAINLATLLAIACGWAGQDARGSLVLSEDEERALLGVCRELAGRGYDDVRVEPLRDLILRMEERA